MKEMEFEMFVEPLQASLIGECREREGKMMSLMP